MFVFVSPLCRPMFPQRHDLHRIGAARLTDRLAHGDDDDIAVLREAVVE